MNLRRSLGLAAALAAWFFCACFAMAQNKAIRLRNETIQPPIRGQAAPPNGVEAGRLVSGLFLVQFTAPVEASWTDELRGLRVQLLRYVPRDTYVAQVDRVDLRELRALPFVHWVGEYRADHKLHRSLRRAAGPQAMLETVQVAALFSSVAPPGEMARARAFLFDGAKESHSRAGIVLRGRTTFARLNQLAESPAVLWIEPAPKFKLVDEVSSKIVGGPGAGHSTFTQENGFDGRGVTVAVADSGLHIGQTNGMHPDLAGRVKAFFAYDGLADASDEHSHGTHVTGIIAGNGASGETDENGFLYGLGVAPQVDIVVQRLFDGEGVWRPPPDFGTLTGDAVSSGAVIGSNSWGEDTQGRYDMSAMEFDALVRDADPMSPGDQPYILEFSAGNAGSGPQTIGSPAVAKNVIATGASENDRLDFFIYENGPEVIADFSSRGPCEDGRIKPDLVAPGTWIASLRSPLGNDDNAWAPISDLYLYQGGTSQAGPQVSGAAAVFVQYYRQTHSGDTPSPALVKAALINGTTDLDDDFGTGPTPNMDEGWGRVDLTQLILSQASHEWIDQTNVLSRGQIYTHPFVVASASSPLRITLAYTDFPGFPAAIPSLVNDLDLELVAPDGRIYRGNQFDRGESVPDAPSADDINNVEGIYISEPLPGEYVVRVRARVIIEDTRSDVGGDNQDFALAISADLPPPSAGLVLLDRTAYTAPGRIQVKVIDRDRAGQPSLNATVRSATEPAGELLILHPATFAGTFTGSVATVTGSAAADGRLQIAHGSWIQAQYFDASANATRVAQAVGDLVAPQIGGVTTTNQFGQTVAVWTTDEPASSIVRFGLTPQVTSGVTNRQLTMTHELPLGQLIAGQTYYYYVISIDAAGNVRTNNDGNVLLSFVAKPTPTVLLVDGYAPLADPEQVNIPLSAYTDAMSETGVSFDVWSTEELGMPTFETLRPYLIVMWRINDNIYAQDNSIPTAQQNAIQRYLDSGGSFFMASMEILSRLGPVPFRTNALHVGSFLPNLNAPFPCEDCDEDFGVSAIEGLETDTVSIGIAASLDYTNYPVVEFFDLGPDFSDTFGPTTNASVFLVESVSRKACGMRFPRSGQDSTGRVVFCSFPLDTIPESGDPPNNRAAFLGRVFQFLAPGLDGVGSISFSQGRYRLPDLLTIEVADSDLAGLPSATVNVSSTSDPLPITVELHETVRRGLFRGFVPLVSGAGAPGQLSANDGDQIFAEYFDASESLTIETFANVDAVPATISNLSRDPEFEHVTIQWNTSEPCDALVQYGESALLGKAVYEERFDVSHELRIAGLAPDRTYYYRVVSRDLAGNASVADNGGQPFMFHTRAPLPLPFDDPLDAGTTNWSVFSGDDSAREWTLGPVNNGFIPYAHSPPNSWASNPQGTSTDTIDTFLIGPAVELTGGNVATLRFWHGYDFTERTAVDLWDFGELLLFTNTLTGPVVLTNYVDSNVCSDTDCWQPQEFDLTPYIGLVVIPVWHHQLLSFEAAERPGWVVDDVSITITNIPIGTIQFSNNLAQASFMLTGTSNRAGQGLSARFVNLPAGPYDAVFAPVEYYQTPPPQSHTLSANETFTFQGSYTFPDSNTNGISDLWETAQFGPLDPMRSRFTDTDGDGYTDYEEFIAGTNPNQANSYLQVRPPAPAAGGRLRFQWTGVAGRAYQLQGTHDFNTWVPLSPWLQTNTSSFSYSIPVPPPTPPEVFRLEVRP